VSAAVGRRDETSGADGEAVMVVTTDAPVPADVIERIVGLDGFVDGRTITL
jgi:D-3-phosphoglycerate dehydrogenase / 2-oxoglutarate reductase